MEQKWEGGNEGDREGCSIPRWYNYRDTDPGRDRGKGDKEERDGEDKSGRMTQVG